MISAPLPTIRADIFGQELFGFQMKKELCSTLTVYVSLEEQFAFVLASILRPLLHFVVALGSFLEIAP